MDYEPELIEVVQLIEAATQKLRALRDSPNPAMSLDRRALAVAITNAETANLWAAYSRPNAS